MPKLFFLLSGEHETLPFSELHSILEAEGHDYRVLEKLDQVDRLEASLDCLDAIKNRAAFTKQVGLELANCEAETTSIVKAIRQADLSEALTGKQSFAVRVKRVRNYAPEIDTLKLERKLGELVLAGVSSLEVDLENPERTLMGILTKNRFIFGLKLAEIPSKPFVDRRPRKKPFFHPSAMQAKLARGMINLAKPRKGEWILDPFCGTGTMLIEAALIGCHCIGLDIQRRMARGTMKNLTHFNTEADGVVLADAACLPITKTDCIVADPPYGILSTTMRRTTRKIIEDLLTEASQLLTKSRRVCLASPKTLKIGEIAETRGFKQVESHLVYVHRSLTREIAVFEKV